MQGNQVTRITAPGIHQGKQEVKCIATTSPKAEKRIPSAWNENHEISFLQEPECDQTPAGQGKGGKQRKSL